MRSPETTLSPNPFAYDPSRQAAPAYQQGENPFTQQSSFTQGNVNPFQYNNAPTPQFYNTNPFAPQGSEQPFAGFGEQQTQTEAIDGRPPLSERLKEKIGTVVNLGGRAIRSLMGRAEGNQFAAQAIGHADQLRQQYATAGNVAGLYNRVQQGASTAWNNPQFQQAANYAGGMAKETAFAGARGALDHLGEQTGVSYDKENGLSVKKTKLARFAAKAFFAPHATAANTLRGAATAGVGAAKQEGWSQFNTARDDAKSAAMGYAQSAVGWR